MKKILEIDQYWELLNQYQEKIPDMVYNHMMLPGEAASHIEASKLYYEEQKKGIVFSVKEKDFCKLYFYISEGAEIHLPEEDRPQLIECIYREDKEDIHIQKLRKKTEESGFYPYVKNKRIRAEIQEQDLIPLDKKNIHQNLLWKYDSEEEIPAIYKLWEVMDMQLLSETFFKQHESGEAFLLAVLLRVSRYWSLQIKPLQLRNYFLQFFTVDVFMCRLIWNFRNTV